MDPIKRRLAALLNRSETVFRTLYPAVFMASHKSRFKAWVLSCFNESIYMDKVECGLSASEIVELRNSHLDLVISLGC